MIFSTSPKKPARKARAPSSPAKEYEMGTEKLLQQIQSMSEEERQKLGISLLRESALAEGDLNDWRKTSKDKAKEKKEKLGENKPKSTSDCENSDDDVDRSKNKKKKQITKPNKTASRREVFQGAFQDVLQTIARPLSPKGKRSSLSKRLRRKSTPAATANASTAESSNLNCKYASEDFRQEQQLQQQSSPRRGNANGKNNVSKRSITEVMPPAVWSHDDECLKEVVDKKEREGNDNPTVRTNKPPSLRCYNDKYHPTNTGRSSSPSRIITPCPPPSIPPTGGSRSPPPSADTASKPGSSRKSKPKYISEWSSPPSHPQEPESRSPTRPRKAVCEWSPPSMVLPPGSDSRGSPSLRISLRDQREDSQTLLTSESFDQEMQSSCPSQYSRRHNQKSNHYHGKMASTSAKFRDDESRTSKDEWRPISMKSKNFHGGKEREHEPAPSSSRARAHKDIVVNPSTENDHGTAPTSSRTRAHKDIYVNVNANARKEKHHDAAPTSSRTRAAHKDIVVNARKERDHDAAPSSSRTRAHTDIYVSARKEKEHDPESSSSRTRGYADIVVHARKEKENDLAPSSSRTRANHDNSAKTRKEKEKEHDSAPSSRSRANNEYISSTSPKRREKESIEAMPPKYPTSPQKQTVSHIDRKSRRSQTNSLSGWKEPMRRKNEELKQKNDSVEPNNARQNTFGLLLSPKKANNKQRTTIDAPSSPDTSLPCMEPPVSEKTLMTTSIHSFSSSRMNDSSHVISPASPPTSNKCKKKGSQSQSNGKKASCSNQTEVENHEPSTKPVSPRRRRQILKWPTFGD